MHTGCVIVFDLGKTLSKLSLCSSSGQLIEQRSRPNKSLQIGGRRYLDSDGIESWAAETLRVFSRLADVVAIVPVGHGAAAAIVRDGRLGGAIPDYEDALPAELNAAYDLQRDSFALSGSPRLPQGLNLGAQLFRLEHEQPDLLTGDACILPWPQYWAWRFCGVMSSEVTSLGCHSDLWQPESQRPSNLAQRRGWAARFAPLRRADEPLGILLPEWCGRTALPATVKVYCGLHDSNAALLAARGFAEISGREATVLSTGTWFVAMRTLAADAVTDLAALPEQRDCLVNVDVAGRAIPSARFMGGREIETLGGLDPNCAPQAALAALLANGTQLLPSWASGVGPYPRARGHWHAEPPIPGLRSAAVGLYAALMSDTLLELIGTRERVLIEGRFARDRTFITALATLRKDLEILVHDEDEGGVTYGALRLVTPQLPPPGTLQRIAALDIDLAAYQAHWKHVADTEDCTA